MNPLYYIPIAIVVLVVLRIVIGLYLEKQRAKKMRALASSMNFSFDAKGDEALVSTLTCLPLLSDGRDHTASNVISGRMNEVDVSIMDYEYYTGSAGSKGGPTRHIQTVIQFQCDRLRLPSFTSRPQHWLHGLATGFGFPDIDFDSHPKFSKQHLLQGVDETAVRKVFQPDVLEFYEKRPQWGTAGDADRLVFCMTETQIPPQEIRAFMEDGNLLLGLLEVR